MSCGLDGISSGEWFLTVRLEDRNNCRLKVVNLRCPGEERFN